MNRIIEMAGGALGLFFREMGELYLEMAPYLLLGFTVAGILSVLMTKRFVARHIGHPGIGSVLKASLLGVPLPLCSCGVVPTASYLKNAGASRPAVMSFLISTPQTGVDSIAATYGMLGPLFALFRPIVALITGLVGGIISTLDGSRVKNVHAGNGSAVVAVNPVAEDPPDSRTLWERLRSAAAYGYGEAVDDIAVHFIVGLAIAGLISLLIPDAFFTGTFLGNGFPAMVLMVLVGIPMYVCSTSSIPIAVALIAKGISPGAAYVFLVAGPATNAATLAILTRVLGRRQTVVYVATIIAGSLAFGPVMDMLTGLVGWTPPAMSSMAHEGPAAVVTWGASAMLALLLGAALFRRWWPTGQEDIIEEDHMKTETSSSGEGGLGITRLSIGGMSCHHCVANVESALSSVAGAESVQVNLKAGEAVVTGAVDPSALAEAVRGAGYTIDEE